MTYLHRIQYAWDSKGHGYWVFPIKVFFIKKTRIHMKVKAGGMSVLEFAV